MRYALLLALVLLAPLGAAAQSAPGAPPPVFTFTEAQTKIIVEVVIKNRDAAAAEYNKWNDLLMEVQKQVGLQGAAAKPDAKEPEKAP